MRFQSNHAKSLGFAVLAIGLLASGWARANGGEFFEPADEHAKVALVYFGHIKDQDGRYLDDANVTVSVKDLGMTFPFVNDSVGHYRSPDIGAAIKEIGEKVDPAKLEITCSKEGYKQVKPTATLVPNKADGTVEIDFVLARN